MTETPPTGWQDYVVEFKPKIFMWEILVPTVRMDGTGFYKTRYHRVWDEKVRAITGGLTIMPPAKGQWVSEDDDELFVERMIPVRVAATEAQLEAITDMTLEYYDQRTVLAYKISDDVRFKNRKPK